jgi:hypothetical protein
MNELEMRETSPGNWELLKPEPKQGSMLERIMDVALIICITLNVITFSNVIDAWLR